jgi:hypothetical protein
VLQHLLGRDGVEDDPEHARVVEEGEDVAGEWRAAHRVREPKRPFESEGGEVEVGPPEHRRAGEGDHDREGERGGTLELERADADRDDRLPERDDDEEPVPLGEVRRRDAEAGAADGESPGGIQREGDGPDRGPEGLVLDESAGERDERRDEEPGREPLDRALVGGVGAKPVGVERDVQEAHDDVGDGEPCSLRVERVRHGQRHEEAAGHRGEDERPDGAAPDVDRVREPRVAGPRPPEEPEDERRACEPARARVREDERGHLRDREDEDEVEEELEVARPPLAFRSRLGRGELAGGLRHRGSKR